MLIDRKKAMNSSPIILAVDTDDLEIAKGWIDQTQEFVGLYKLGLEFYVKFGPAGVKAIQSVTDRAIFLDLKLHDIPNTVGAAAAQVAKLGPRFLTIHASGGTQMIAAAVKNAPEIEITAVTILTSLNQADLTEIGFLGSPQSRAQELAKMAVAAGARAIVCSPLEISLIREVIPQEVSIITPGIRPKSLGPSANSTSSIDDQKRVMDPRSALAAGANFLVIGRPITAAANIKDAAAAIFAETIS